MWQRSSPARSSPSMGDSAPSAASDAPPRSLSRLTSLTMKLGLGLYRGLLTEENFQFAQQAGVTHLVVHLVNYFAGSNPTLDSGSVNMGWGVTPNRGKPGDEADLRGIKKRIEAHGLVWE